MPTVATLPGHIRIEFYRNDHDPPHFHVVTPDVNVQIMIADLSPIEGMLAPRTLRAVREWATRHQAELALNWVFARAKMPLRKVDFP